MTDTQPKDVYFYLVARAGEAWPNLHIVLATSAAESMAKLETTLEKMARANPALGGDLVVHMISSLPLKTFAAAAEDISMPISPAVKAYAERVSMEAKGIAQFAPSLKWVRDSKEIRLGKEDKAALDRIIAKIEKKK